MHVRRETVISNPSERTMSRVRDKAVEHESSPAVRASFAVLSYALSPDRLPRTCTTSLMNSHAPRPFSWLHANIAKSEGNEDQATGKGPMKSGDKSCYIVMLSRRLD